jgi:hypothetical protein
VTIDGGKVVMHCALLRYWSQKLGADHHSQRVNNGVESITLLIYSYKHNLMLAGT